MRPTGKVKTLFDAFSRIAARAFTHPRLVSCHVLAKAPNYDDVLRRYLLAAPIRRVSVLHVLDLFVRHYCINGAHLLLLLLGKAALIAAKWPMPESLKGRGGQGKTLVIDTFLVLPKVEERKRYTELYMPGLADAAQARGMEPVHLFRLYGSRDPRLLYRVFCILRDQGVVGVTELHLFTFTDWLALARHWLLYPFAHWGLVRSLSDAKSPEPEAYIRDALIHCLPQCYMIGEGRRLAAKRLAARLPGSSRIASWYENQIVNKAFQLGLFEEETVSGRHIPVTGAQLFIWPDNLLNNHADDGELPLHLTPDSVLVNGPYFLPENSGQNYAVGPALRYASLFDATGAQAGKDPSLPLLALLSYHPEETERVLTLLREAASESLHVVYKFHPATKVADYAHLLPPKPLLAQGSLYSALNEASMVLGAGSGSLAEAVALGVPAIAVQDPASVEGLGLNYLPPAGKGSLWADVRHADELPEVMKQLTAAIGAPGRDKEVTAFRALLFAEPAQERIVEAFSLN